MPAPHKKKLTLSSKSIFLPKYPRIITLALKPFPNLVKMSSWFGQASIISIITNIWCLSCWNRRRKVSYKTVHRFARNRLPVFLVGPSKAFKTKNNGLVPIESNEWTYIDISTGVSTGYICQILILSSSIHLFSQTAWSCSKRLEFSELWSL